MIFCVGYAAIRIDPYNPPREEPKLLGSSANWYDAIRLAYKDAEERGCTAFTMGDPTPWNDWWELTAMGNSDSKGWRYKIVQVTA